MPFLPSLPKGANLLNLFKAFPDTSIPLIQFHEALLRRPSPFTEGERELIAAYVSGLNHCRYCNGVHSATAEFLGIKRELVDSRIDIDGADVDPKIRPVLRYARKLTQQPQSDSSGRRRHLRGGLGGTRALLHGGRHGAL